jgi:hypothetical protein
MAKQKKEQKPVVKPLSPGNSWLKGKRLYALIIFAFSFGLYFNTLFNGYNLDDELVTNNHRITSKGWDVLKFNFEAFNSVQLQDSSFAQKLRYFVPIVFTVPYYQDNAGYKYEYRPLVFASFALEHALFAKKTAVNGSEVETDSPTISHFINILLYAFLCVLLFLVLCKLFRNYNIIFPLLITLLFAAFPMHTEDVASIKNRDELLALIFGLLSLNFSWAYIQKSKPVYLVLVLLFFTCGILSKPTTITFVLLIPLCLVVFANPRFWKLIWASAVIIIPSVFYSRRYTAFEQITLGAALFFAVTALYILKNRTSFLASSKASLINVYSWFRATRNSNTPDTHSLNFNALKKPLPVLLILFGAYIPALVSIFGIQLNDAWLTCVPLIFICALYIFAADEIKLILITPIALVMVFARVKFPHHSGLIEMGLIVFLASHIFSGPKAFRIAGLVNYLIFTVVSVICLHSFNFLFIIFFIGLLNRKLLVVSLVLIAGSVILFIKKAFGILHHGNQIWSIGILLPLLYAFFFLLWKSYWPTAIRTATAILPLSLIVFFTWAHPFANNNTLLKAKGVYHQINSIKAADPTPVQSVRPLIYPEYPLGNNAPLSLKFGTSMEVLGKYLCMVLVPYPMSYYYGYSVITPQKISDIVPVLSLLIHLLLLGIALYFFEKKPVLSFAILFYLISISVFSNLVMPVPGLVADRFLLIPSIGFCILLVFAGSIIFKQDFEDAGLNLNSLKQPLKIAPGVILVLYSGLTFSRNMQWKDQVTLFRHDITVVENSAQAQNLLGIHLFILSNHEADPSLQKQLREEAVPHFKKALEIYPGFMNASYDLGRTLEALKLNDEAFAQYQVTVKIDTTFVAPYFNMATIMHNKGQYEASIPLYQKFITQYPLQLEAYTNLSFAYFQLKDYEKSIATNRLAIKATGEAFYPTVNIAKTYTVMGQADSALFYFEQAHTMHPNDAGVNMNISKLKGNTQ